jgi:D-serine deaminase-like pyridoxal phosphate-dependent protein
MKPNLLDRQRAKTATAVSTLVQPLNKGLGELPQSIELHEVPSLGWNLLREDVSLPAAVLDADKLEHNLRWMQAFAAAYGAKLAPHGKTTMAPQLFHRQLQAGAWGITVATAHQAQVAHAYDVPRVLMANQLVGRQNMATVSRLLEDPEFDFYCLVDSPDNTEALGSFFQNAGQRLNVLLELGAGDGRTGVRNREQLDELMQALARWPKSLRLCGVEVYEGVLSDEDLIRGYLHHAVQISREFAEQNRFERSPVILSGAGSAWYDVVAEVFSKAEIGAVTEILLRPGCYLTHDVGGYRAAQEQIQRRNPVACEMQPGLQPALQLWAYVQSIPEREKAIIALGKRDAAFDAGLPSPALHYRPGNPKPTAASSNWQLTRIMDQHAFLQIAEGDDIRVGDMISFDISHPCLTFDKWRCLLLVDSDYNVLEVVQTFF